MKTAPMCILAAAALLVAIAAAAVAIATGGDQRRGSSGPAELHFDRAQWRTDLSRHVVPLSEFEGVGVRDGIPAIERPRIVSLARAERFLHPREPVVAVELGGAARAYPLQILLWHEVVNDRLGGRAIAVTKCPLCNSTAVFDRRLGGRTLSFAVSGLLRHSDLVVFDRQTESWWQQITARAVVGRYAGARLRALDSQILGWRDFRRRFPHGDVLARPAFSDRSYGRTRYAGYEDPRERPFFFYARRVDRRLPPKERVAAVCTGGEALAVPFSTLRRQGAVQAQLAGTPVLVTFDPQVLSVLDSADIRTSRPVGAAAAFDRRIAGRRLSFRYARGRLVDDQTGSRWDPLIGRAIAGPLRGRRLRRLRHDEQFWFALAAFYPHATIAR